MLATPTLPTEPIDLRLVVSDMDGTLLDGDGAVTERASRMLDRLAERGITFATASGRQYPALAELFPGRSSHFSFIAENGTMIVHEGAELSCSPLDPAFAVHLVRCVRSLVSQGRDLGTVWCGRNAAWVDRSDAAFLREVHRYYAQVEVVDSLLEVPEEALKVAVYDFKGASETASILQGWCEPHQVVVSSEFWLDIMGEGVTKGAALSRLQAALGVTPEQTVVFGDYLNDLEMLQGAPYSFAMANAHPDVLEVARYVAPANTEHGVAATVESLLDAIAC